MKQNVNCIIFLNDYLNIRAGGPSGYVANLKKGYFQYINKHNIVFISKDNLEKQQDYKLQKIIAKLICSFIPIKKYRKKLREKLFRLLTFVPSELDYLEIDSTDYNGYIKLLNNYEFKTIICHSIRDAIYIKNYLNYIKSDAKLLLMSHSPQPPAEEVYHYEKLAKNPNANKNHIIWQHIQKRAFEYADVFIFPTKEAMEPYINGLDYFKQLVATKELKFITTGCDEISSNATRNIRAEFNIKTKYIISFIGRHTSIKGYDILKEVAQIILAKRNDVTFVIGGAMTDEFDPLDNPRWIELGKINPADLLQQTDLFILPNRQTYFDLILLEVLSAGVFVLASNTGGNKSVYSLTNAIEIYDSIQECVDKIEFFLNQSENYRNKKAELARISYLNNYTLEHFAKNYDKLISELANIGV